MCLYYLTRGLYLILILYKKNFELLYFLSLPIPFPYTTGMND
nr:MAG TPA: hypothetical protein [Caudoviricetes sp.]